MVDVSGISARLRWRKGYRLVDGSFLVEVEEATIQRADYEGLVSAIRDLEYERDFRPEAGDPSAGAW